MTESTSLMTNTSAFKNPRRWVITNFLESHLLRLRKQNRFMNFKNSKPNTIKPHEAGEQKKANLCHFVTLEIFVYVLWTQSASSLRSHELEKRFEFNETPRKAPRLDPIMSFRKQQTRLSNGLEASSELYEDLQQFN